MKELQLNISKSKIIILVILFIILFSISKIGMSFASTNSFAITSVEVIRQSNTIDINDVKVEKNKLKTNITFHNVGESITYKIKVKNNDKLNYTIKSIEDDNENKFISYTYDNYEGTKVNAQEETTFEIIQKYVQECDFESRDQSFQFNITVTLEDENGDIVEKTIPVNTNPKTGDNIGIYITILLVSITILVFLSTKNKVQESGKHSNKRIKLFSLFIIGALILPNISRAAGNLDFSLNFENNVFLRDKLLVLYSINGTKYEKIVNYNEELEELDVLEIEGYEFVGWQKEDGTDFDYDEQITEDLNIKAKYKPIDYTITYNELTEEEEEAINNPTTYTIESDDITLNNPTRTGHTFKGWTGTDLDEKTMEVIISNNSVGNREYTANFEVNSYVITFDSKGGSDVDDITKKYDEEIGTLPVPNKERQVFVGWYEDEDYTTPIDSTTKVTGEKTYYAKWRDLENFEISFDTDGGNDIESITVEEGSALGELQVPEKENYKFRGWYTNKQYTTKVDKNTIPTGNTTYYAKWIDKLSTVFSIEDSVTFNGKDTAIADGEVPTQYLGTDGKYVDTHIALFSEANYDKDFEMGFTIEHYDPDEQDEAGKPQYVFVNTKDENGSTSTRPGFVFRVYEKSKYKLELGTATTSTNNQVFSDYSSVNNFKIFRENKKIYYSLNGGEKKLINSNFVSYTGRFNATATFGASVQQNGTVYRHLNGTLSNMYIKLENDDEY